MSALPPAGAQAVSDLKARVEAERAGRPFLLYRDRGGRQRLFIFAPGAAETTVGRQPGSDLLLDWDTEISRRHARFVRLDEAWTVVDDGRSRNGTFVNGERLTGVCRLKDGDIVQFGTTTVTFRSPEPEQGEAEIPVEVGLSTSQRRVLVALCRPYTSRGGLASPATDEQIAEELCLSVGAVRTHLRILRAKLGVAELPAPEGRLRLVQRAVSAGLISERDL